MADDEVIEQANVEEFGGVRDGGGDLSVVGGRCGRATRMIMEDYEGSSSNKECGAKDLGRLGQALADAASRDVVDADHSVGGIEEDGVELLADVPRKVGEGLGDVAWVVDFKGRAMGADEGELHLLQAIGFHGVSWVSGASSYGCTVRHGVDNGCGVVGSGSQRQFLWTTLGPREEFRDEGGWQRVAGLKGRPPGILEAGADGGLFQEGTGRLEGALIPAQCV